MAHIYMTVDFGSDEEQAQQAWHKLEMWKQAFRLDKKLLYKFERGADRAEAAAALAPASAQEKEETKPPAKKGGKATKGKDGKPSKTGKAPAAKAEAKSQPKGDVKLHLRLAFSAHEKMTEERIVKKIASEEPFAALAPKALRPGEPGFEEAETQFEALE